MFDFDTKNAEPVEDDPFVPPQPPRLVYCTHCNARFMSSDMKLEHRFGPAQLLWWCATPECDGAGYGFDIFDASP